MRILTARPGSLLLLAGALGPLQPLPVRGVMDFALESRQGGAGTRLTFDYRVAGAVADEWPEAVDGVLGAQLARLREYV